MYGTISFFNDTWYTKKCFYIHFASQNREELLSNHVWYISYNMFIIDDNIILEISCSAWNNLASSGEEVAPFSSQDGTWCRNFHRNEATKAQKLKMKPQKLRMLLSTLRPNTNHMVEKNLFWFSSKWSYKNSLRIRV